MSYRFAGRLCGHICDDCEEPLVRAHVRLYRAAEDERTEAYVQAPPKDTFARLTREEADAKEDRLIGEGTTDEQGEFAIEIDEQRGYRGGPVEVDAVVSSVAGQKETHRHPVQLHLTIVRPEWDKDRLYRWVWCIPFRFWCALRAWFGAWTICGWVGDCKTGVGARGMKVRAFDADCITDDFLGEAATDGSGHFRIDYSRADFHKTFLSPFINLETPWPPLDSGPDVYFQVETGGGQPLVTEHRADGHQPGRENAPPCLCVKLCVTGGGGDTVDTIPLWQRVGQYRVKPADNDFTAAGLTTAGEFAFTGNLELNGILPDGQAATAIEYRFRAAEYTPALGPVFDLDATSLGAAVIGHLEFWDFDAVSSTWTVDAVPYWVNNPGATVTIHRPAAQGGDLTVDVNKPIKAGGWVEVPRENDLSAGGIGRFTRDSQSMGVLLSETLTQETVDLALPAPGLAAGQPVPAPQRRDARRWKLFFEAREVAAPNTAVGTNTLEKIAIINLSYRYERHPNWAPTGPGVRRMVVSVNIQELLGPGGGCAQVSDHVHALYTVYHPFARSGRVYFEGNAPLPAQLSLTPIAGGLAVSPAGGHDFGFATAPHCAFILWLEATVDLTSGYGRINDATDQDHIAFCKA
jgi:hypothetical protein